MILLLQKEKEIGLCCPRMPELRDFFPLPSPEKLGDLQIMTDPKVVLFIIACIQLFPGPVIGLEYNGKDCINMCLETAKNIATSTGCTGLVYVSTCPKTARKQIESFFSHADVQLSSQ
ncbi:protein XRP2 [Caerostris extrusa]|uniref:Protein XRP2 n=1 Tax=Caerostris extrusa TaxID=172846 RepID=A0AAV4VMR3_CAEEX|nr:protein XRP2 [Caerostris extrusa]